jgi:hypothetical protein
MEQLDLRDQLVQLALLVLQDHKESLAKQQQLVQLVRQDLMEQLELRDQLVQLALLVLQVLLDLLVQLVHKVYKDLLVRQDQKVIRGFQEIMELMVQLDL